MSSDVRLASPDPDPDLVANLKLYVRETRIGRWMWELIDARDGASFERAFEFDSADDARRAGLARLGELTPSLGGAKMAAKNVETPMPRRLVIVARDNDALYEELQALFADDKTFDVIRDRRHAERRRLDRRARGTVATAVPWVERRRNHRRRGERRVRRVDPHIQAGGWRVVPRSDSLIPRSVSA